MEILTSQAVLTIFGILAVYFGVKLVAVAFRLWTPRHRSLTLDEAQLKGSPGLCAGKRRAGLPVAGPFVGTDALALWLRPGGGRRGGVCGLQSLSDQKIPLYRPGYRKKER